MRRGNRFQDQKQQDCMRAFRDYFDKAQLSTNRDQAISLYREGLTICPGRRRGALRAWARFGDAGRRAEAEKEFEAALKINPDFADARRQLDQSARTANASTSSLSTDQVDSEESMMSNASSRLSFALMLWHVAGARAR